MDAPPRPTLSPLALRALRLVAVDGLTEREAAEVLHYSRQHVANILGQAYRQLGAKNVRQAIYLATRLGLLK
jgi:DNA-binding CsgD family transcriptional regulator